MSNKHQERQDERIAPEKEAENELPAAGSQEKVASKEPAPAAVDESAAELAALRERVALLESREAALTEECSSLKDQYLRKLADYENFRKRMFREKDEALKFANNGLLGDLITILDDFDRAIDSAEHVQEYKALHDGVVLIRRQFGQMLSGKYCLSTFDASGQPFDPNIHEAVASEVAEVEEPIVAQVFLPGYKLHDRVVRSAKVKVQMPAPRTGSSVSPSASNSADGGESSAEQKATRSVDGGEPPEGGGESSRSASSSEGQGSDGRGAAGKSKG